MWIQDLGKVELPRLFLSVIISKPIVFIREFFENMKKLAYTDEKIDLYIYCNQKFLEKEVSNFISLQLLWQEKIIEYYFKVKVRIAKGP